MDMEKNHHFFMQEAILLAKKAESLGEVPIGAVIVKEDRIIGRGYNRRELDRDPLGHAEIMAIREASAYLQEWRLLDCRLYVTLEPCPMCAGAIIQSRLAQVIFGTEDPKSGYAGSLYNLLQDERLNHQTQVIAGLMKEECQLLLKLFFQQLRLKRNRSDG